MNKDKNVFAQLVKFLDCSKFRRIAAIFTLLSVEVWLIGLSYPRQACH